jgi:hypothetical protein
VAPQETEVLLRLAPDPPLDWDMDAACRGLDTESFYGTSNDSVSRAKGICGRCFVQGACLSVADELEQGLGQRMVHGIWGGLTPDERIERRRALTRVT